MTKRSTSTLAGLLAATVATSTGVILALGGAAAADTPPWLTGADADPNAVGTLTLHDATGAEVTSGDIHDAPFAAYVVGSDVLRSGDGFATLFAYTPDDRAAVGSWTGLQLSGTTDVAHTTLPEGVDGSTPVAALDEEDTTLAQYIGGFENTSTAAGYAGVYELRVRTTSAGHSVTPAYDAVDIVVEGDRWRLASAETGATTTTTLSVGPENPKVGTTLELDATVSGGADGKVQFKDGPTNLGKPVDVVEGEAGTTTVVAKAGSHTYQAVFTPTDPDAFQGSEDQQVVSVATATSTTTATWPASLTYGTAGTVTVKVAAAGVTPTGTVKITSGSATVGTGTLSAGSATVRLSATALQPGSRSLVATYAGTADVRGSSSATKTVAVAKAKATAVNTLMSKSVKATRRAKLTVKVTATGTVPTGAVSVYDGRKKIATGALSGGKVVVTLPKLKKGSHKIHAVYAGSAQVGAATASVVTLTVIK